MSLIFFLYLSRPYRKLFHPSVDSIQYISRKYPPLNCKIIYFTRRIIFLISDAAISHSICIPQKTRNTIFKTAVCCCLAVRNSNTYRFQQRCIVSTRIIEKIVFLLYVVRRTFIRYCTDVVIVSEKRYRRNCVVILLRFEANLIGEFISVIFLNASHSNNGSYRKEFEEEEPIFFKCL